MTEHRSTSSNTYQGGSHFEFSSEKNWGIEQDDCRIFNSIDLTHLADSIASVPFHLRHTIPVELFTVEQLEEFEVESSLALSRHMFQCNSKLSDKTTVPTSRENNLTPETNNLMKLIMNNFSGSTEENSVPFKYDVQSTEHLDAILGNMKPLINILQDETNIVNSNDNTETSSKIVESPATLNYKIGSEIEVTNHNSSSHWLDSMLDSDE